MGGKWAGSFVVLVVSPFFRIITTEALFQVLGLYHHLRTFRIAGGKLLNDGITSALQYVPAVTLSSPGALSCFIHLMDSPSPLMVELGGVGPLAMH